MHARQLRAVLALALAPLLAVLAPAPLTALTSPGTDVTAPLVGLVGLAAWACSGWLLLLVAVTFAGRLPGPAGHVAHRVSLRVAPASVRSLVRIALGAGVAASVLTGPALAFADSTPPPAASSSYEWPGLSTEESPAPVPTDLDWPGSTPTAGASTRPSAVSTAAPTAAAAPRPTRSAVGAGPSPAQPVRHATQQPQRPADEAVVVQVGDSLWDIAARALGPGAGNAQIAQEWPRWWAANRALLGDDPGLIHPGNRLIPPTP